MVPVIYVDTIYVLNTLLLAAAASPSKAKDCREELDEQIAYGREPPKELRICGMIS